MIPAASSAGLPVNTGQPGAAQAANKASQPQTPEAPRSSAGETTSTNGTLSAAKAVTAPEQSAAAPRLRDQETAEQSERDADAPAGPPPAFEESYLERQARVAFDPPDPTDAVTTERVDEPDADAVDQAATDLPDTQAPTPEPPPTPTERAEVGFAETRTLASPREPTLLDVSR